jgi:hypothetical protein
MTTNFPASLDNFTNPNNTDTLNSPSHSAQHADVNDAVEALQAKVGADSSAVTTSLDYKVSQLETNSVTLSGSETLTNKTLTAPVVNNAILQGAEESWNVSATASTGTINFDTLTSTAWLYTTNASGNWTLNVRGDGSTTLASLLNTGDSITVVFAATQGSTPYYASAFQIDGNAVTPEWQGGSAPSAGNASSIDVYVYTIIKTAATPTYTVLASQTQFA